MNRMKKYQITIITPVFNQQNCLINYIMNIKKQTYGFKNIQVILINDGSTDNSGAICDKLSKKYKNIIYIKQQNKGVSAARNAGLRKASGKYIFFVDADDVISKNTTADCVKVFDKIYDQVDLLTYPIETYYKGRLLKPHFRYQYLKENGNYDLCANAFIGQTTMNIVVKNLFDKNAFFDEDLEFSEDQKYCCEVLRNKLEMGFCSTARYTYNRSDESSSGKLSGACYIFETSLKLFEDLFARYEYVPLAFQGLYVNDIYWKMLSNMLFPYHYSDRDYRKAMSRVRILLRRCDNFVILSHPNFDFFEKFYLMRLKGTQYIETRQLTNSVALLSEGNIVLNSSNIEIVVTRLQVNGTKIRLLCFLKSVFFQFYKGTIALYPIEDGIEGERIAIYPSAHNYYLSHEPTQRFWRFEYKCDVRNVHNLSFKVRFNQTILGTSYYFMPLVPISRQLNQYSKDCVQITFHDDEWDFCEIGNVCLDHEVWLYYDCIGVEIDNGLRQFLHDVEIQDGVDRFYVVTDERQKKYIQNREVIVEFGSNRHVKLLLKVSKVITAFIENNNIFPFSQGEYNRYANKMRFETIYLQHGVLHIDMPWKYSPEKIIADKVVVACDVDYRLFRSNGFNDSDLWKIGLSRFDRLHRSGNSSTKKILYAPSWRNYLVGDNINGQWQTLDKKFIESRYYARIKDFLESEGLNRLLEEHGYELDVKMHPIFQKDASNLFKCLERVCLKENVNEGEYNLFITDFSSYMFDFIYMGIPILSFIPDYEEFKCGMNGYRNVDFMNYVEEDMIAKSSDELIDKIEKFFVTKQGVPYEVKFFEHGSKQIADLIYERCKDYKSI